MLLGYDTSRDVERITDERYWHLSSWLLMCLVALGCNGLSFPSSCC